ncbi:MAG TPA: class I SAM-dependent methyltransferase [Candidatus Sulfotelmatobacter sp.]
MPGLDTKLHLDMLAGYREQLSLRNRVSSFLRKSITNRKVYGLNWGDPETAEPLRFIRDRYVLPYVKSEHSALEIGPGGGRWTRYLLPFRRLYVVDYHQELLDELRRNFRKPNMVFVKNNGSDFPGVPVNSVDFIFTFGTFVHLDTPLIDAYLESVRKILRPGGNAILHYSDKTKIMARENTGFSENTPDKMRQLVLKAGFTILEEDLTTMWHSSLMRLTL